MNCFYVVISPGQGAGRTGGPVFTSRAAAEQFLQERQKERWPATIEAHSVRGAYKAPDPLFSAHQYLPDADEFEFVGLFADFNEAKRSAGDPSNILQYLPTP